MTTIDLSGDVAPLSHLDLADLRDEYVRRRIDEWSDRRLVDAVSTVVSHPRRDPADSFVLHAPLELAARAALLPRVAPDQRVLARLHVLALAAQYQRYEPVDARPVEPADLDDPHGRLLDAIAAGDPDAAVPAAAAVATRGRSAVLELVDPVAPSTAAAGHAPIFLYQVLRGGARRGPSPRLLPPLARELARHPEWRIAWVDDPRRARPTVGEDLTDALTATPSLGVPGSSFIHPLMMQVDQSGLAADLLGDVTGTPTAGAIRAVLRAAARSMLVEPCEHAPYGWSHCLTMPQALLGLMPVSPRPERLLALAATEVVAFRAALGTATLPTVGPDDLPIVDADQLATLAATAHDAHVVKYVLACLDAADADPAASALYLAAGQRLLDCWTARGGDPADPLGPDDERDDTHSAADVPRGEPG